MREIESQIYGATVMQEPFISNVTHLRHQKSAKSYSIITYLKEISQRIRAVHYGISTGTLLQLITTLEMDEEFFRIGPSRMPSCRTRIVIGAIRRLMAVILLRYQTTTATCSFKMAKSTGLRISIKLSLLRVKILFSK